VVIVDSKIERTQIINVNPALTHIWIKYGEYAAFYKNLENGDYIWKAIL
jgi:hypothetical protein